MKSAYYLLFAAAALPVLLGGCGESPKTSAENPTSPPAAEVSGLKGAIKIDGSSTVYPISSALVEGFKGIAKDVRISIAEAGTGAGFKKLANKEIDIANASKPVSEEQDADLKKNGVDYIELGLAYDGLSIVVNPQNTWAKSITTAELKKIWSSTSKIKFWNEVNPAWPKEEIKLYGPTSDHGSYEYFNEVINGNKKDSRQDYNQNNDYNALVQGVSSNKGALGYVGYAYVLQNEGAIISIPVDAGNGPVAPSKESIAGGSYSPLSRPLLMYVTKDAAARPEVKAFVDFIYTSGIDAIGKSGYIPFPDDKYASVHKRFSDGVTGSEMLAPKGAAEAKK